MPGKLTTYDPAEDLASDAAIATFMAEAFATQDAGYIAHALGINDLQFGIIVIVNLTMGMITPPVGGLLFVTSLVAKVPLTKMVKELWPFMYAQLAVLGLLSLIPAISTWLPNLFGYK